MLHLDTLLSYVKGYCSDSIETWCSSMVSSIESDVKEYHQAKSLNDEELLKQIVDIHAYSNQ